MSTMLNIQYVTVQEAADIIGVTDSRVRQMLIAGEMHGEKFGQRTWMVPKSEAERVAKKGVSDVGRPRRKEAC